MAKIIVVGAGLFGSIAATLCRRAKHQVTVVDWGKGYEHRASIASGCLLKPSWLSGLSKEQILEGYQILDELYGVERLRFLNTGILGGTHTNIDWVDPAKILVQTDIEGCAGLSKDGDLKVNIGKAGNPGWIKPKGDKILIAAGCLSAAFAPIHVKCLAGLSMRFKGQIDEPKMRVYAPYKQAVAFNINKKEVWFGDGTAILAHNWVQSERLEQAIERADKYFGLKYDRKTTKVTVGWRPYVEGHKNGYFEQIHSNVWVSTGGAKNGTLLAALQAKRFLEAIS